MGLLSSSERAVLGVGVVECYGSNSLISSVKLIVLSIGNPNKKLWRSLSMAPESDRISSMMRK